MLFRRKKSETNTAISRQGKSALGRGCALLFFLPFLLIGLGTMYALLVKPLMYVQAARNWVETPCQIVSSELKVHRGEDTTYSVEIVYTYKVNGKQYESSRYDFIGGSSSARAANQAIVNQYPAGAAAVCFVDPNDPAEAVINREFSWMFLALAIIPLVFTLVGGGGILTACGVFKFGQRQPKATAWLPTPNQVTPTAMSEQPAQAGPVLLKPARSPWGSIVGVTLFSLFWNGIVSVFLWQVVEGFRQGNPEWFLTIFMIPFVLVGLGSVGAIGYYFLALFNPRPTVTLSQPTVTLGGALRMEWKFSGRTHALQRLQIHLRGEESATYRRGTDTYTDTERFVDMLLFDSVDPLEMASGVVEMRVPDDTMHSFNGGNNQIKWTICIEGDIRRWPDVRETFPLVVLPHPVGQPSIAAVND